MTFNGSNRVKCGGSLLGGLISMEEKWIIENILEER